MLFHTFTEDTATLYYVEADDTTTAVRSFLKGHEGLPIPREEWQWAVGPRLEMMTSWCSNVLSVLAECGIQGVRRIERFHCFRERPNKVDELTEMLVDLRSNDPFANVPQPQRLEDGVVDDIEAYNKSAALGFDDQDLAFYRKLFSHRRNPTVAELHDLSNCNSEHSRHHLFRGQFVVPVENYAGLNATIQVSLMDLIRLPLQRTPSTNSVVAMCDNASAIEGWTSQRLEPEIVDGASRLVPRHDVSHITFTAETHNFPTGIAPFQGATTGTGGRIRDTQAIGRGGTFVAGTAGYCVGRINPWDLSSFPRVHPTRWTATDILLCASDGASDYGNKVGEPVIQGFTRSYGDRTLEWLKPIMFSGGIGRVKRDHAHKEKPLGGMAILRVGGPTYRIGIGGGAASSTHQSSADALLSAVQRGDPQLENRMDRWLRACIALPRNPIVSIHDQGAGGMGNVTKEICEGIGAAVTLKQVEIGDQTLSDAEIWVSESQEQNTVLIRTEDEVLVRKIAAREGVTLRRVGTIKNSGRVRVHSRHNEEKVVVDLPVSLDPPRKIYHLPAEPVLEARPESLLYRRKILEVLRSVDVCSKRFLTNKVDRSVGGLIAQQQCVGPQHVPVADVAVVAHSFFGFEGAATAIGEQPIEMMHDLPRGVRKAVAEMCTNLVWAPITAFTDIKCSVNWMWPAGTPEGKATLLRAVKEISDVMCQLGIAIDGGKDSVSMSTTLPDNKRVDSPPQVVVSGYAACPDVRKVVTPGFKRTGGSVWLVKCDKIEHFPEIFQRLQTLIRKGWIVAGHDVSDGGLLTTLAEMCFASENNYGFHYANTEMFVSYVEAAHRAEAAVVFESSPEAGDVMSEFHCWSIEFLGMVTSTPEMGGIPIRDLRDAWESTATQLEKLQTQNNVAEKEHQLIYSSPSPPIYVLPDECQSRLNLLTRPLDPPRAAVIRGEGSNGDREMHSSLWMAGFDVFDVTTSDLTSGRLESLDAFHVAVFVGGFTYSDVLGAAAGWAAVLSQNEKSKKMLEDFRQRPNTLMLGVCNGCQLLTRLGWVGDTAFEMQHNTSGRFESRFATVGLEGEGPWLDGLSGARLGVWVAHGEGRFPENIGGARVAMRYVDGVGAVTMQYPLNPNGSPDGVAGITSDDGRVLALMPHPERCVLRWQLPWMPANVRQLESPRDHSPWILLFRNALEWCSNQ